MRPSHGNRTGVVERALEAVHGKNVPIGAGTDAGEGAALIDLHRAVDDEIAVDGVGTTYLGLTMVLGPRAATPAYRSTVRAPRPSAHCSRAACLAAPINSRFCVLCGC
jgi:hypothetical protein